MHPNSTDYNFHIYCLIITTMLTNISECSFVNCVFDIGYIQDNISIMVITVIHKKLMF